MRGKSLKEKLDALNRYLEKKEGVYPNDPFFLLVAFAEGARTAIKALLRAENN